MKSISLAMVVALAAVGVLLNVGCESTSTSSDVITLTPASVSLVGEGATATFVAAPTIGTVTNDLILPLKWSISRGDLGRILSSAGVTAVYESNGKLGANAITVVDQIGQAGAASISQVEAAEVVEPVL